MNEQKGRIAGIFRIVSLLISWGAIWAVPSVAPPAWVPRIWLFIVVIGVPCAIVAGVTAARTVSSWRYLLVGVAVLSGVLLLASVAD